MINFKYIPFQFFGYTCSSTFCSGQSLRWSFGRVLNLLSFKACEHVFFVLIISSPFQFFSSIANEWIGKRAISILDSPEKVCCAKKKKPPNVIHLFSFRQNTKLEEFLTPSKLSHEVFLKMYVGCYKDTKDVCTFNICRNHTFYKL